MDSKFRANDLPRVSDIRVGRGRSHKLHSHGNRGRLIAPGGLRDELTEVAEDQPVAGEPLAVLAARYGLHPSSARPGLVSYLSRVWQRRQFIFAYATARNVSMYTEARLGQLWQVLTPLLNSAVYYLIFGILFKANRGISNYTAYLFTGVFIFAFTERSIVVGSTVIRANITLIRALHFPRACLPLAYVLVEFQQQAPSRGDNRRPFGPI
jgi:teichoic acid transport system permease protein